MIPFNARYHFALATEEQICDALHDLRKSGTVSNDDDLKDANSELEIADEIILQIGDEIARNPKLISNQVLGAFVALAMDGPHRDINEDPVGLPHEKSPEQDLALSAVRALGAFKFCRSVSNEAWISRLEKIAMNCMDRDIRKEAIGQIFCNVSANWNTKEPPVLALHYIARHNTDLFTRIEARNKLISLEQSSVPVPAPKP